MNDEVKRLESYEHQNWPCNVPIATHRLANAGFYYEGVQDTVRCFSCYGTVNEWKAGHSPKRRHKDLYPKCKFVRGEERRNIPINYVRDACSQGTAKIEGNKDQKSENSERELIRNFKSVTLREHVKSSPKKATGYFSEFNRLQSFKDWAISSPVDPYELASSGFYQNEDNKVKCFACFIEIHDWRLGDRPLKKHKEFSPSCPFVNGLPTGNCPMTSSQRRDALLSTQSKFPQFASLRERLLSFADWPDSHPQRPSTLARAGFFANNKGDMVTCFWCGCRLLDWDPEDNPWEEHSKWSPQCSWLIHEKEKLSEKDSSQQYNLETEKVLNDTFHVDGTSSEIHILAKPIGDNVITYPVSFPVHNN